MKIEQIHAMLEQGLKDGVFSCYAAAIGEGDTLLFRAYNGNRMRVPDVLPLTEEALFDMASLTKVVGTTMAALRLIDDGKLALYDTLDRFFDRCYGKETITVRHLMTHTAGLEHVCLWEQGITPEQAVDTILRVPPRFAPGEQTLYSCIGYILLGKILETIEGEPLDRIVKRLVFEPLGMTHSCYCPPKEAICVATEVDPASGIPYCGVVHDENARFMRGVSGNAGMFCPLDDVIRFATMLSKRGDGFLSSRLFELAVHDFTPACEESRGLGFQLHGDKPFPAGDLIAFGSYGHTGFTGTSLYVDAKSGRYVVLLTNRIHPSRDNPQIFPFRRRFHNLVFSE